MALNNVKPPNVYFLKNKINGGNYEYILNDDSFILRGSTAVILTYKKTLKIEEDGNYIWVSKIGNVSDQIIDNKIINIQ